MGAPEYYASAERGRDNRAGGLLYAYEQVLLRRPSRAEGEAWLNVLQQDRSWTEPSRIPKKL